MRYVLVLLSLLLASSAVTAQTAAPPNAPGPKANVKKAAAQPKSLAGTTATPKKKVAKKQQAAPMAAPPEPVETEMVPEQSERDRVMNGRN